MFTRLVTAHLRWYAKHKRLAWALTAAELVAVFVLWWALFGFLVAVIVEVVVLLLTVPRWMMARRRLARRELAPKAK